MTIYGRSEERVSRCVECDLVEPESLASLGGSAPGLVDGILSDSEERPGYWVRFGEHCGDAMTHKILDHDTQKIIYRTAVRHKKSSTPNHRLAAHGGSSGPSEDKISMDHHLDSQMVPHRNRRPLQSSSGPEMKTIHLDPSLCLPLTPVT